MGNKEIEYWQCSHTRKCKWVGKYEELDRVPDKEAPEIMTNNCCPKCGNLEFYVIDEEEFKKLQSKE